MKQALPENPASKTPAARIGLPESVVVSAPARLHFGLFSTGAGEPFGFGGAGLMLKTPRTCLQFRMAEEFRVLDGGNRPDSAGWLADLTRLWQKAAVHPGTAEHCRGDAGRLPPVEIRIVSAPARHCGLGSGTQMALAVAAGLNSLFGMPGMAPGEMALAMGRGRRSAIGSHGFFRGGFLVDRGLKSGQRFSPLELRLEFPENWPVVLILPDLPPGSHGQAERAAFEMDLRGQADARQSMVGLLNETIIPSIAAGDWFRFASAIRGFNQTSGGYYQKVQDGLYHSQAVASIAGLVQDSGVPAVVQSSWGPGLAAIAENTLQARLLVEALTCSSLPGLPGARLEITSADNRGATVSWPGALKADPVFPDAGRTL